MSLSDLLARARPLAEANFAPPAEGPAAVPRCTLFFSACDGRTRAKVVHATGAAFDGVWREGAEQLVRAAARMGERVKWLRIDWVAGVEPTDCGALARRLAGTKRNYFRYGLAFDAGLRVAFLEQELNANAMLYGGATVPHSQINAKNFAVYQRTRFGDLPELDFSPDAPVYLLATRGLFCSADEVQLLAGPGPDAGRRILPGLTEDAVASLIEGGSEYLARQVGEDGRFQYGWFPCFDREIPAYNALRHASTTYAMLEAWEQTRSPALGAAIDRALHYLITVLIRHAPLPDGTPAAFLVDGDDEIKLGGNAVCVLALAKHAEFTGARTHLPLLEQLALGIAHMQDPESGAFVHVLEYPGLAVREPFRIIYYDGEAAFGLMRLFALTGDARWLAVVENAFAHFIAAEHWKAHDHWLSYCVNELTRHRPERRYFEFGLKNVADHLDFVLERETTFPTLLELMMAARQMLVRIEADPSLRPLLAGIDVAKFERALHHRAHHLLNGHFWPEFAMYFRNPDRIVGSFFIRHHAFRVRIDDVEHYLSGLVAYRSHLRDGRPLAAAQSSARAGLAAAAAAPVRLPTGPASPSGANWTAATLAVAARGVWRVAPANRNWAATGLCISAPGMQPGNVVALRPADGSGGMPAEALARLPFSPQAVIVAETESPPAPGVPVLEVANVANAVLAIGRHARSRLQGQVIGVTGSAGKTTTCAMLAQALRPWGEVGQTRHNANLPHGIAWNLASIPWSAPHVVVEMAIGRMQQNSALVRPRVAVFTNVAAAHLEYHGTTAEVARRKSRIFSGMPDEGVAVLNRDMDEWPIVVAAARERGLRLVRYGTDAECEARLVDYDPRGQRLRARFHGRELELRLAAPGIHMAYNALACLSVVDALGLPIGPAVALLELFRPLAGRGEVVDLIVGDMTLRVVDDAYNANPASMRAAIRLSREHRPPRPDGRRVLVLGDMLELGDDSRALHAALAPAVFDAAPDVVLLCGDAMQALFDALRDRLPAHWFADVDRLNAEVLDHLRDGDLVAVKSSKGTGLSRTVQLLKDRAAQSDV